MSLEIKKNLTSKGAKLGDFPNMRSPKAELSEHLAVRLELHIQRKRNSLSVFQCLGAQDLLTVPLAAGLVRKKLGLSLTHTKNVNTCSLEPSNSFF